MSVAFTKFHPAHIRYIRPASVQSEDYKFLLTPGAADTLAQGLAMTAWHSGQCLGAAGVIFPWEGRAELWALLSPDMQPFIRTCVRQAKYVLSTFHLRRIDMVVKANNTDGCRLAKLLGFELEGLLEGFHPDGSDMAMYKRIRQWPLH